MAALWPGWPSEIATAVGMPRPNRGRNEPMMPHFCLEHRRASVSACPRFRPVGSGRLQNRPSGLADTCHPPRPATASTRPYPWARILSGRPHLHLQCRPGALREPQRRPQSHSVPCSPQAASGQPMTNRQTSHDARRALLLTRPSMRPRLPDTRYPDRRGPACASGPSSSRGVGWDSPNCQVPPL